MDARLHRTLRRTRGDLLTVAATVLAVAVTVRILDGPRTVVVAVTGLAALIAGWSAWWLRQVTDAAATNAPTAVVVSTDPSPVPLLRQVRAISPSFPNPVVFHTRAAATTGESMMLHGNPATGRIALTGTRGGYVPLLPPRTGGRAALRTDTSRVLGDRRALRTAPSNRPDIEQWRSHGSRTR